VVAPASEMSRRGAQFDPADPSDPTARPAALERRRHAYDCITLALNRILPVEEHPAICASGINHGGNLGDDATYSGTVAGALEATILGVPVWL